MANMDNGNMPPINDNNSNGEDDIYANLYTFDEAAVKLKRHKNTINNMCNNGELDKTYIGRTPYVFKDQVDNIAERNRRCGNSGINRTPLLHLAAFIQVSVLNLLSIASETL